MTKLYRGYRHMQRGSTGPDAVPVRCVVMVEVNGRKRPLRPRHDIRDHSPDGFEWGYGGSGPAQLALALVADACGRAWAIPGIYQRVKAAIVAGLPHDGWVLTQERVKDAAEHAKLEYGAQEVESARREASGSA